MSRRSELTAPTSTSTTSLPIGHDVGTGIVREVSRIRAYWTVASYINLSPIRPYEIIAIRRPRWVVVVTADGSSPGRTLAPLDVQKRIVAKVEHLMKLCDDLEANLQRADETARKLVEAVVVEFVGA